MKAEIKVDGQAVSTAFVQGHESEAAFLEAMAGKTYGHLFPGPEREAKLKELYALAVPKKETVQKK